MWSDAWILPGRLRASSALFIFGADAAALYLSKFHGTDIQAPYRIILWCDASMPYVGNFTEPTQRATGHSVFGCSPDDGSRFGNGRPNDRIGALKSCTHPRHGQTSGVATSPALTGFSLIYASFSW